MLYKQQMMPRLTGCLFKFIQKQPPDTRGVHSIGRQLATQFISDWCKKTENYKRCSQKFLTKFTRKTPVLESLFQILLKKRLWHLFSCEFCEISKNTFFTASGLQSWRLLLLFIDLYLTFLSPHCSQLAIGTLYILRESVLQLN